MKVDRDELWLCADCFMIVETGDDSALDHYYNEQGAKERREAISKGLEKLGPHLVPDNNSETGEGQEDYYCAKCACCDKYMPGHYQRYATLVPDKQ